MNGLTALISMVSLVVLAVALQAIELTGADDPKEPNKLEFITDVFSTNSGSRANLSLNGVWEFKLDKEDKGTELGWQTGAGIFEKTLKVPGVPQSQGIGVPNRYMKNELNEPYWIRRSFSAPKVSPGKRVWLRVGGILPAAKIYLNGEYIGFTKSSRTQQRVDVTSYLKHGETNLIAIRVCDWPKVKLEGIWEWAEIMRFWTGPYRPISLEVTNPVSLIDVYVNPKLSSKTAQVSISLSQHSDKPLTVFFRAKDGQIVVGKAEVNIQQGAKTAVADVKLSDFTAWSPEHPKLYNMEVTLKSGNRSSSVIDKVNMRFGMREIKTIGTKFYLNGKPIYLRCFGDDQFYPETIAPPADKKWYLKRLKLARTYGFNSTKSCEEIYNQDYLEAADEAGIMIIQEMPFGLSGYVRTTQNVLGKPWRDYYARELEGLIKESRNNPSVIAYSMCSEVYWDVNSQEAFDFYCKYCTNRAKELAPHCIVIDNTGYAGNQQTVWGRRVTDFYAQVIPTWCKEALDETPVPSDGNHPTILHEYNWWSYYADPNTRKNYKDAATLPWWLDELEATAKANGQWDLVPEYVKNSLYVQTICRKDGLEYARRCPNVEGFILWLLTDYGQYTEGVLDDFWKPKNVSAKEFLKYNGETVIVLSNEGNRCLVSGIQQKISLAVSHYGEAELDNSVLKWSAKGGPLSKSGSITVKALHQGKLNQVGSITLNLPAFSKGYKIKLHVELYKGERLVNSNDWLFWAMPETKMSHDSVFFRTGNDSKAPIPDNTLLVIADSVDEKLADYVESGGKCILFGSNSALEEPETYYQGYTTFRTIPWNGAPGNSGTLINDHPALESFPHDKVCDFQFAWLIKKIHPMNFEKLRAYNVFPIIRGIDFYRTNKNLTYMMEFKVCKGSILVTSLGVLPKLEERLEARYLLKCLADYATSSKFTPTAEVPKAEFVRLFSVKQ